MSSNVDLETPASCVNFALRCDQMCHFAVDVARPTYFSNQAFAIKQKIIYNVVVFANRKLEKDALLYIQHMYSFYMFKSIRRIHVDLPSQGNVISKLVINSQKTETSTDR